MTIFLPLHEESHFAWKLIGNIKVGTLFFHLDCHVMMLIYYELIQYTSKRICDFEVYASVLCRGLICVRLRFWM